jgi:hypothetical protein
MAKLKYTSSRVTSRYRPATTRLGSTLRRFRRQPWSHKTFEHGTWGDKLIVMGLIAHTCVEATVRYAAELGYEVDGEGRDRGLFG